MNETVGVSGREKMKFDKEVAKAARLGKRRTGRQNCGVHPPRWTAWWADKAADRDWKGESYLV